MKIPKKIHQLHTNGLHGLTEVDRKAISILKKNNPDWEYFFYDLKNMIDFIKENYSSRYLNAFLSINPIYGAAQADYFRYLLMYKLGGAYFDVKSYTIMSLNQLIDEDDELIVFEWQGGDAVYASYGIHKQITRGREYQQWNIICSPNNIFLKEVIEQVTLNIENYSVKKFRFGKYGVLHTTGPVPYTNAIDSVKDQKGLRLLGSSCKNGLIFKDGKTHQKSPSHYSNQTAKIVLTNKNAFADHLMKKIWILYNFILKLKGLINYK